MTAPRMLAAACCLIAGLTAAAAQEPAREPSKAPETSTAAPSAPPGGEITGPRNNAAKIAGLVGFVNVSCDALKGDTDRFKAVVSGMGVDPKDLESGELLLRARSYLEAYRKDVPANCKRAADLFGKDGSVVPGLVVPR
ncbi:MULTISPECIES: hypothetical protein [Methylobacterium]|uniref:Photosystem reaction center subunit H n=2 Tax=Pseudomonadota TaxID=1224 RepID=A0ABQ4SZ30_9HYPH|nr:MULTISPECIES: hypothetical protein [Methylobacterium]PIU08785.1 MAG: hypothetical protein COT56_00240 [Methylobacterium sp. CG09_land_8_20_14_0_10_71_15]PIU11910.1 MAG: hypothetical protein COT28_17415 [Methylobacterium sp. CG08_land_8_20_14_0_20_71_15]GJE07188.1 hypothetical protein AOPFMNJM_2513 [Methylobacterium jeotgali]